MFAAFVLLPTRFWPRTDRELPFWAIALLYSIPQNQMPQNYLYNNNKSAHEIATSFSQVSENETRPCATVWRETLSMLLCRPCIVNLNSPLATRTRYLYVLKKNTRNGLLRKSACYSTDPTTLSISTPRWTHSTTCVGICQS